MDWDELQMHTEAFKNNNIATLQDIHQDIHQDQVVLFEFSEQKSKQLLTEPT